MLTTPPHAGTLNRKQIQPPNYAGCEERRRVPSWFSISTMLACASTPSFFFSRDVLTGLLEWKISSSSSSYWVGLAYSSRQNCQQLGKNDHVLFGPWSPGGRSKTRWLGPCTKHRRQYTSSSGFCRATLEHRTGSPTSLFKSHVSACCTEEELTSGRLTNVSEKTGKRHPLGTHLKGEDLDWIQSLHGCPSKRVAHLEDIDESEDGLADWWWHRCPLCL